MNVKFRDIIKADAQIQEEINENITKTLKKGNFIGGQEVEKFANNWAKYCNAKYCVTTGNGLDSIRLTFEAMNFERNYEVMLPSNTFIASWFGVTQANGRIVAIDPLKNSFNIGTDNLNDHLTDKTRVLFPTHLYGQPADLEKILEYSNSKNLTVIEDAAQAHGATFKNKTIGAFSKAACWSFYPTKNLAAYGDAGAVTTNDLNLYLKIKKLANYGSLKKNQHEVKGWNSRMDTIQAAVLNIKLKYLDSYNYRRKKNAEIYLDNIKNASVVLPKKFDNSESVWHQFVIKHKDRDGLKKFLLDKGIETMIHYPKPPALQRAYYKSNIRGNKMWTGYNEILSLPIGPELTESEIEYVIKYINKF